MPRRVAFGLFALLFMPACARESRALEPDATFDVSSGPIGIATSGNTVLLLSRTDTVARIERLGDDGSWIVDAEFETDVLYPYLGTTEDGRICAALGLRHVCRDDAGAWNATEPAPSLLPETTFGTSVELPDYFEPEGSSASADLQVVPGPTARGFALGAKCVGHSSGGGWLAGCDADWATFFYLAPNSDAPALLGRWHLHRAIDVVTDSEDRVWVLATDDGFRAVVLGRFDQLF